MYSNSAFVPNVSEGNVDIPNRFRIVDRPPEKRPPPHKSGRRYKHRPRYAIKTRSRKLEHEPPEGFKKYKLKPWKQRETPPDDNTATSATSKKSQKPYNPRPVTNLIKKQDHISAMDFDHPIRVLNLGTAQAFSILAQPRRTPSVLYQGTLPIPPSVDLSLYKASRVASNRSPNKPRRQRGPCSAALAYTSRACLPGKLTRWTS
jgi:hypothetical protein